MKSEYYIIGGYNLEFAGSKPNPQCDSAEEAIMQALTTVPHWEWVKGAGYIHKFEPSDVSDIRYKDIGSAAWHSSTSAPNWRATVKTKITGESIEIGGLCRKITTEA